MYGFRQGRLAYVSRTDDVVSLAEQKRCLVPLISYRPPYAVRMELFEENLHAAAILAADKSKTPEKVPKNGFLFGCLICKALIIKVICGERGIRTPGTVIPYVSLANWWFKPLTHLSGLLVLSGCKYKPKKRLSKAWWRRKCRRPFVAFGPGHFWGPVKTTEQSGKCLCRVGRRYGEP